MRICLTADSPKHCSCPDWRCSEFAKLGLTRSVGGVLALALARELTPVVTSIIIAGRVGSAFAAELGTMQVGWHWELAALGRGVGAACHAAGRTRCLPPAAWVASICCRALMSSPHCCFLQVSEQTDSLRVLGSDPVDYLITPRVLACMIALPILNLLCFCMGGC